MDSHHSRDLESDREQPLLHEALLDPTEAQQTEEVVKVATCRSRVWTFSKIFIAIFLAAFASAAIYMWQAGMFDTIDNTPIIDGDSVIEPNTNVRFEILKKHPLTKRPAHLVGVALRGHELPVGLLKIYVVGLYVDLDDGKLLLSKWKGKAMAEGKTDTELVSLLSGGEISGMLHYEFVYTIPGTKMLDYWADKLADIWRSDNVQPADVNSMLSVFKKWFHSFRKNDEFSFNWIGSREKALRRTTALNFQLQVEFNGEKKLPVIEENKEYIHGVVLHEFDEVGGHLHNLVGTLFH